MKETKVFKTLSPAFRDFFFPSLFNILKPEQYTEKSLSVLVSPVKNTGANQLLANILQSFIYSGKGITAYYYYKYIYLFLNHSITSKIVTDLLVQSKEHSLLINILLVQVA